MSFNKLFYPSLLQTATVGEYPSQPPLTPVAIMEKSRKPKRHMFQISPDLEEQFDELVKTERRSISNLLNWLVTRYLLEQQEAEANKKAASD